MGRSKGSLEESDNHPRQRGVRVNCIGSCVKAKQRIATNRGWGRVLETVQRGSERQLEGLFMNKKLTWEKDRRDFF